MNICKSQICTRIADSEFCERLAFFKDEPCQSGTEMVSLGVGVSCIFCRSGFMSPL